MMSLTFGLFNQVSGLGPLGPLVEEFPCVLLLLIDLMFSQKKLQICEERQSIS